MDGCVFKRYETKYLISKELRPQLLQEIEKHMELDQFGRSQICNVYFDTETNLLIRHSINKPPYKEKIRIRSYGNVGENGRTFIELKKKYEGIVYKRRFETTYDKALLYLKGEEGNNLNQIQKEIQYFISYYHSLSPSCYLSYMRMAYYSKENKDLRITFDDSIIYRTNDISLSSNLGSPILDDDLVLMEIKVETSYPLWLCHLLTHYHIYQTSFSKYGEVYQKKIKRSGLDA